MGFDDTAQITLGHEIRHGLGVNVVRTTGGDIHGAQIVLHARDGTQPTITRIACSSCSAANFPLYTPCCSVYRYVSRPSVGCGAAGLGNRVLDRRVRVPDAIANMT
jgi:hypothetical protein